MTFARLSRPRVARLRMTRRAGRNGFSPSLTTLEPRQLLAGVPYATLTRSDAASWFQTVFQPLARVPAAWTGSVATGNPGTLNPAYLNATLGRINAYRYMAGLPDQVALDADKSRLAQAAALMMSANGQLSHAPPSTWLFYTSDGATGAGKSNLALGAAGSEAIDLYMGEGAPAGHRRWLLYPPQTTVGIGDVPTQDASHLASNATYVLTGDGPRTGVPFVAWPAPGFLPTQLVPDAWSFAVDANTDFASANVSVTKDGSSVPVNISSRGGPRYGDPAIEWTITSTRPSGLNGDQTYQVAITNAKVNGQTRNYNYSFTVYDPLAGTGPPDPGASIFSIASRTLTVQEGAGFVDVVINREGDLSGLATLAYSTVAGTAGASDFTPTSGRWTFAAGVATATIRIPILNDSAREGDETFSLVIDSPTGGSTDREADSALITLSDDDQTPTGVRSVAGKRIKNGLSEVVIAFNDAIDPDSVTKREAFSLRRAGRDRRLGTADDLLLAFTSLRYDATTRTLRIVLAKPFRPREVLRLVVKSALITNPTGQSLDGDGDGRAGGDAIRNLRS